MSSNPSVIREIFLQPGELHFGDANTRIHTILGSCISIVMWHKQRLIGGMCHYILPDRRKPDHRNPDCRYADEALEIFMKHIEAANTLPQDYQVKIFGGGNMFPAYQRQGKNLDISSQNINAAHKLIRQYHLNLVGENVGGSGYRKIVFEVWSGHVWVRHDGLNLPSSECVNV